MNDNVVIALIGAAAGIIGAFKLPEIIKDIREMLATKNKALVKKVIHQKEIINSQKRLIEKYDQLKYKIPLIVDFVRMKNKNDPDTLKLMDMLEKDYTITAKSIQELDNEDL